MGRKSRSCDGEAVGARVEKRREVETPVMTPGSPPMTGRLGTSLAEAAAAKLPEREWRERGEGAREERR